MRSGLRGTRPPPVRGPTAGGVSVARAGYPASMATDDKIDNKAQELTGKVKEGVGRATDDPNLETQGKNDQTRSNIKQAGEKVKDAFKR